MINLPYKLFVSQLVAIMDHIPSGIVIALEPTAKTLIVNRAARDLLGLSPDEAAASHMPQFRTALAKVPVTSERLPLQRAMQSNAPIPSGDYEIVRADGMRRFASVSAAPLHDSEGNVQGGVAVLVDVTTLRILNDDLRDQRDELTSLIFHEQYVAETLQNAQLPHALPSVPGFSFTALYRPAGSAQVGGDWYDAFPLGDGRIGFSVGDVMGNGLEAAVTMGMLRQAIQSAAFVCPNPPVMLSAAGCTLELHDRHRTATAVAGVLNPKTATLTFASAGHPLPILRRTNGGLDEFCGSAPPLGVAGGGAPTTHCARLDPGDLAVFYTDGLIEATRNPDLGERVLRSALVSPKPVDFEDTAEKLHHRVVGEKGSADDVAILTVARQPS